MVIKVGEELKGWRKDIEDGQKPTEDDETNSTTLGRREPGGPHYGQVAVKRDGQNRREVCEGEENGAETIDLSWNTIVLKSYKLKVILHHNMNDRWRDMETFGKI